MAHQNNLNLLAENRKNRMPKALKTKEVRTLDELGVLEAIRGLAAEFEKRNRISCQTYLHVDPKRLRRDVSAMLFWIIQETLSHVGKHSFVTQVEVYLEDIDNALFLGVNDNGKEIRGEKSKSSKLSGTTGLRERVRHLNGKFDIQTKEKAGTMVSILIPIEGELFYHGTGR